MRNRTPELALVISSVIAAAVAQPSLHTVTLATKPWPVSSTQLATLAVGGPLTGTGYGDAVVVVGGIPYLFRAPALFGTFEALPGSWSGVTGLCLRRPGPTVNRQQILVSDSTKLRVCVVDAALGTLAIELPVAGFAGASSLSSADVNGDGYEDLIALDSGKSVLRILPGAAVGVGTARSYAVGAVAGAVTSVKFSASATERKIAFVVGGALQTIAQSLTGSVGDVAASSYETTIGLAAANTGNGQQKLAWVTAGASGSELVFADDTTSSTLAIPRQLVAITVADVDGDGLDDVVASQRDSRRALILVQRSYGFVFSAADALEVELVASQSSQAAPNNAATPALADLDGDGDLDLVHAVQDAGHFSVALSSFHSASESQVVIDTVSEAVVLGEPRMQLSPCSPITELAQATHLEVLAWRMEESDQSFAVVPGVAAQRDWYPLNKAITLNLPYASFVGNSDPWLLWVRQVQVCGGIVQRAFSPRVLVAAAHASLMPAVTAAFPVHVAEVMVGDISGGEITGGYIELGVPPPGTGGGSTGGGSTPGGG